MSDATPSSKDEARLRWIEAQLSITLGSLSHALATNDQPFLQGLLDHKQALVEARRELVRKMRDGE